MNSINSKIIFLFLMGTFIFTSPVKSQDDPLEKFAFLIGNWIGQGSGFGNQQSTIESTFKYSEYKNYIEVKNESRFEPTKANPDGSHHIDKGFISYDQNRSLYVFRQFNSEGYVNQYVLQDDISSISKFIFETEEIENFVAGGRARWTINKLSNGKIETVFDVSLPGKEYACFGSNILTRK